MSFGAIALVGGLITMFSVSFGADFYTLIYKVVSALVATVGGLGFCYFLAKVLKK